VDAGSAYVFEFSDVDLHYQSFTSIPAQDGWILESRETSGTGGVVNSTQAMFMLGDSVRNQQYRAVLSFNTGSLPDHAVVISALLKIRIWQLVKGNPFLTHKPLIADIRQPFFATDVWLEPPDFQSAAGLNRAGTFRAMPNWGWYSAPLAPGAFPFINLGGTTQLRLRFALDDDNDLQADYATFLSGNAALSLRPVLIIKYAVP